VIHPNIDKAMTHVIDVLLSQGVDAKPRGKLVKELIGQSVCFDMKYPIVTKPSRKIGYRFYPAEAAWILSGRNDVDYIKRFSPFVEQFSDDGFFYQGAYGPRVVDQLTYVCDMLADDPDTRQAVIEVWRPNPRAGRDIPCTLSYQFLARGGHLHCVQDMRSSDAWLGYPYDAFNAAMLTTYIILLLRERKTRGRDNLEIGTHTMQVGSQHLYERDWENALHFLNDHDTANYPSLNLYDFQSPSHLIEWLLSIAEDKVGIDPRR
jgi:thymidylate synthase